jgi:hypothetical protein
MIKNEIITDYSQFLNKKLYLIEMITGCLFKGENSTEKLKENMTKIRNICHMSCSDVEKQFNTLYKRGHSHIED